MSLLEVALARDSHSFSLMLIDKFINEITMSVTLEESLGGLVADDGASLISMDVLRMEQLWGDITQQKIKPHALDYLVTKLASNKNERVIMRMLWGLDVLVERMVFSPREVSHALVCSENLRVDSVPFFRCAFKLLLKLIFFSDYKSNREVFNKSIEKSSQFSTLIPGNRSYLRFIDPAIEVIRLLLCREMCLMPAYFAMHELIRSFPNECVINPHQSIQSDINQFMESFARPARLLYSQVHRSIKPVCGVTFPTSPGFRLDSSTLVLTSVKGAMRYPDFLTSPQTQLLCSALGQLRSTELTTGMLDPSTGKSKTRSIGLESALVEWVVEIMEITETVDDDRWVRIMFEHLISVVITFMLSSTIRFNEIVVKLNAKLEGRTWTNSCHYVMWFVLNATSGFIGKNMLTDFVPCLRLFDILFPDAEDPDRALELQLPGFDRKRSDRRTIAEAVLDVDSNNGRSTTEDGLSRTPTTDSTTKTGYGYDISGRLTEPDKAISEGDGSNAREEASDQEVDTACSMSSTSADESEDEYSLDILPPAPNCSASGRKRLSRLMHLATAPVGLWQHVLRKSRQGHDHLPRVMPPALRPVETRISHRMRALIDSVLTVDGNTPISSTASHLTWKQLFVILNAYSTDTEVSQLIQRLVDMFWFAEDGHTVASSPYARLWPKLQNNGIVSLPYGLVARGRLQPLPRHLIRMMSVHLRMLVLHLLLQKFAALQHSNQLTTPAVAETMCRIVACREVEPNSINRILTLLPKLQPVWSVGELDGTITSSSLTSMQSGATTALSTSDTAPGSALSTCNLLATLLDTLGHRLADTLLPEVRLQTLISLVSLLRLWNIWSPVGGNTKHITEDGTLGRDGRSTPSPYEVPLELFYMLEWIICKLSRSIQAPDCIIYGLCLAISPALLAQASQSTSSGSAGSGPLSSSATFGPQNASGGPRSSTISSRSGIGSGATHQACTNPIASDTSAPAADMSGATSATSAAAVSSYPFLMSDSLELNRFTLFSLLQVYYVYDLEEVSGMKAFLVEQIRSIYERCGSSSLSQLPRLVSSRLPEFLNLIIRQLVSPNSAQLPTQMLPQSETNDTTEKQDNLTQLVSMVLDEYKRLSNGETTWIQIGSRGSLLLCVMLRFLVAQNTIPKSALNMLLRIPLNVMNDYIRTLCDYLVASIVDTSSMDEAITEQGLDALCKFSISWRIVPLDRLLLFLLTHTTDRGSQLELTVNHIIVHLFTKSDQLTEAITFMDQNFTTIDSTDVTAQSTTRTAFHTDPIASRYWPTCVQRLHAMIPDQWVTYAESYVGNDNGGSAVRSIKPDTTETRRNPNFPVLYGHLTLRLLPMLEAVFAQFIETELPLVRLIPFCQVVTPLFRFHRRPVNTSFVLLREHWHFVAPDADGSNADNQLKWFIGRLRVQLITHCVLSRHHALAVQHAQIRKPIGSDAEAQSGLLTQRGWSELCSSVEVANTSLERIRAKYPGDAQFSLEAETELESMLYDWYNSHVTCADSEFVSALLHPVILSTQKYGLFGHPAAWRPWVLEENVSIQAAGLYAAAVEIMSSYTTPTEFVAAMTDFLLPRATMPDTGDCLNVLGALTAILPNTYRMAICQFTTSLLTEEALTNSAPSNDWLNHPSDEDSTSYSSQWHRSARIKRHARLLDPEEIESDPCLYPPPPAIAVNFFKVLLPPQLKTQSTGDDPSPVPNLKDDASKYTCLLKANLWHAIWSHANTTHLIALPTLFTEQFVPFLTNEAQLLMAFYMVAPLMGSLHSERPAKLIELTAEMYRAVAQIDSLLATKGDAKLIEKDEDADANSKPKQTGIPLVHVDTIADLLYHIKYMYVGNGVLDQVRPLLPKLRPNLRKRLKFILPPSEMLGSQATLSTTLMNPKQSKAFPGEASRAVYEGRVYRAAPKPPLCGEDF